MSLPEVGQSAPRVVLPRDGGDSFDLSALTARKVVLYFYPKDDTSGCTREANEFTARIDDFEAAGATVIGISRDSVQSHERFRDKHGLKVILLSDEEGDVTEAFGVWVEKSMYGRKFMGIQRATFLIDGEGIVRRVWPNVKVPGHVDEVLEAVRSL